MCGRRSGRVLLAARAELIGRGILKCGGVDGGEGEAGQLLGIALGRFGVERRVGDDERGDGVRGRALQFQQTLEGCGRLLEEMVLQLEGRGLAQKQGERGLRLRTLLLERGSEKSALSSPTSLSR